MPPAEISGWVASAAVMLAAVMTAANLGARVTGWGFVVFTLGSAAWAANGLLTGQRSLLLTNAFLLLANLLGVWRWLGREARHDDASSAAEKRSRRASCPDLMACSRMLQAPLQDEQGRKLGHLVEVMMGRKSGRPAYFVAAIGGGLGPGESLFGIAPACIRFDSAMNAVLIGITRPERQLLRLGDQWPAKLPRT